MANKLIRDEWEAALSASSGYDISKFKFELCKPYPYLAYFKSCAKIMKKDLGIRSTYAHEILARRIGFNSYNHYLSSISGVDLNG